MKCPDCKGSGEYIGARVVEACQRCEGVGVIGEGAAKAKALQSVAKANLPEWMKDYAEKIDFVKTLTDKLDEDPDSGWDRLLSELNIGDTVHVYDAGWYEVTIMNFGYNQVDKRTHYDAKYTCGTMHFTTHDLNYNVTQGRWEIIKAGTPVWP